MTALAWLIPAALFLGGLGLLAFLWALRSGQFEDLEGAAYRALEDDPPEDRAGTQSSSPRSRATRFPRFRSIIAPYEDRA
jgi:cbb3-type cytochrome oxidase maturation protein